MEEYNETKNKKEICVYYPDDTLASITFGYRCDINKKEKIIRTIKRNYPNFSNIIFYDAKPDYVTAKIERVKIFCKQQKVCFHTQCVPNFFI